MTNEQADEAFQTLHDAQRQAQMLYMDLRDAGDQTGATKAKLRVDRLQTQIDNLINKELDDWQANAGKLIPQLSAMAGAVQKAVAAVEADVQNAKKVIQAMKTLDKIISAAVKFVV